MEQITKTILQDKGDEIGYVELIVCFKAEVYWKDMTDALFKLSFQPKNLPPVYPELKDEITWEMNDYSVDDNHAIFHYLNDNWADIRSELITSFIEKNNK